MAQMNWADFYQQSLRDGHFTKETLEEKLEALKKTEYLWKGNEDYDRYLECVEILEKYIEIASEKASVLHDVIKAPYPKENAGYTIKDVAEMTDYDGCNLGVVIGEAADGRGVVWSYSYYEKENGFKDDYFAGYNYGHYCDNFEEAAEIFVSKVNKEAEHLGEKPVYASVEEYLNQYDKQPALVRYDVDEIVGHIMSDIKDRVNTNSYDEAYSEYYSIVTRGRNSVSISVTDETDGLPPEEYFYSIHRE